MKAYKNRGASCKVFSSGKSWTSSAFWVKWGCTFATAEGKGQSLSTSSTFYFYIKDSDSTGSHIHAIMVSGGTRRSPHSSSRIRAVAWSDGVGIGTGAKRAAFAGSTLGRCVGVWDSTLADTEAQTISPVMFAQTPSLSSVAQTA